MLLALAVAGDRCVQDRTQPLALVLPARVVGLRDFAHKSAIH